jgi:RNA polymerase sigma factor (sigma-70 family)
MALRAARTRQGSEQADDDRGRFEENRPRLRRIAYRMLGSVSEADDAVQDTWLRLSRADAGAIENLGGWLTTAVGRACLDLLRARATRREEPFATLPPRTIATWEDMFGPDDEALLAESVGSALLVVLDTLNPAERLSFVLHDMFVVPFDQIAAIVGRSPAAARQLASRARRRVQGVEPSAPDPGRQRAIVDAFLAAARGGDFEALLGLLDPNVVLRADRTAVEAGAARAVRGATAVATTFSRHPTAARPALVNGAAGAVWWSSPTRPRAVFEFRLRGARIVDIRIVGDADRLGRLKLTPL